MRNKFLKWIGLSIASILVSFCSGCSISGINDDSKINIITTIFPEYDWVMSVVGDKQDNINASMLLDSGVDLHNYQPSPIDIINIYNCDLFIYVGGESDNWVDGVLENATNKNMLTINLLETLGDAAKEEEAVEGMQEEEEHEHEGEHEEEEEKEYDEHVWLSLKNAQLFVKTISDSIAKLDAENADYYKTNADTYIANLKSLDAKYEEAVAAGTQKTLLFADRFPFRYLADDYSLKYYAAFVGCSAESEASFQTIIFLANKIDELGLKVILKIDGSDGGIARTVRDATETKDQVILTMDSIQSTTTKEYKNGRNYLSIMETNLDVLKEAIK